MNNILLKMLEECAKLPYVRIGTNIYIRKELIIDLINKYINLTEKKNK